jgi:hypothetical protein
MAGTNYTLVPFGTTTTLRLLTWNFACTLTGMTLKNAAFLALIGTFLLTAVLALGFINDALGVVRGLLPPVKLVISLIQTFAGVTAVVFLYVVHRRQL